MAAVPGDGNALNNMDGLVEFLVLRGKSIAKNLKLSDEGVPVATACASAPAVREFLAKCLHDVYSNKYFGGGKKWMLLDTQADGSCGFESRGIIAGVQQPRDPFKLGLVFSQRMRDALQLFTYHNVWLDVAELIEDVIQVDPRFTGRVVLVRAIATMNAAHQKCSVSMRANQFTFDTGSGICMPENNGAWPLAARPIEPPQPCHGTRAFNSVAPCCPQTSPPTTCSISSADTTARTSSTRPRSSVAPPSPAQAMRATFRSSRTRRMTSLDRPFLSFRAAGHRCLISRKQPRVSVLEGNASLSCIEGCGYAPTPRENCVGRIHLSLEYTCTTRYSSKFLIGAARI